MILKKTPAMNFFCFSTETTLMELGKYVRTKAHEVYIEAVKNNLEITGPIYWVYYGMDGNPKTKFKLDIGVPIQDKKNSINEFTSKTLESLECLTLIHNGTWENLPKSYSLLIAEITKSGRMLNGIAREIYINIDFNNPDNNITEIQMGLIPIQ